MNKPFATIFYGIIFEENFVFPWTEKYKADVEEWWVREVCQFKPSNEIYDAEGNFIHGVQPSQKVIDAYYAELHAVKKSHPRPVEVLNFGDDYHSLQAIVIPGLTVTSSWGYPTPLDVNVLQETQEMADCIRDFCDSFGIEMHVGPKWMLVAAAG